MIHHTINNKNMEESYLEHKDQEERIKGKEQILVYLLHIYLLYVCVCVVLLLLINLILIILYIKGVSSYCSSNH